MLAARGYGLADHHSSTDPEGRQLGSRKDRAVRPRQSRSGSKSYMGGAPNLDQQVAEQIDAALASRQQAGVDPNLHMDQSTMPGSRDKAMQNLQLMDEIEEAIRRRKNAQKSKGPTQEP